MMKQYEGITLQGTNISHLGKRKIIFKSAFLGGYVSSQEGICQRHWSFCEGHRSLADSMTVPLPFHLQIQTKVSAQTPGLVGRFL